MGSGRVRKGDAICAFFSLRLLLHRHTAAERSAAKFFCSIALGQIPYSVLYIQAAALADATLECIHLTLFIHSLSFLWRVYCTALLSLLLLLTAHL
jgi:hypothetical protein